MNDQEMIAVPIDDVLCQKFDKLCECIQSYAQQPGSKPCDTFPFNISGSIRQPAHVACDGYVATNIFQVPPGETGIITQISLQERYPGTLYGANFMVMINDNLAPEFPRLDHPVGNGLQNPSGTYICLEEQDIVTLLVQCVWTPVVFVGQDTSAFQQLLFNYQFSGFFRYKQVA